ENAEPVSTISTPYERGTRFTVQVGPWRVARGAMGRRVTDRSGRPKLARGFGSRQPDRAKRTDARRERRIVRKGQGMKHVPAYDHVVDMYELNILKLGGDLQITESGDLALTAYGDLKLGDDRLNTLRSLV